MATRCCGNSIEYELGAPRFWLTRWFLRTPINPMCYYKSDYDSLNGELIYQVQGVGIWLWGMPWRDPSSTLCREMRRTLQPQGEKAAVLVIVKALSSPCRALVLTKARSQYNWRNISLWCKALAERSKTPKTWGKRRKIIVRRTLGSWKWKEGLLARI